MLQKVLYWLNVVLGLWIAASPFVLDFRAVEPAFYSSVIAGLVVAAFAFIGWLAEQNVIKAGRTRETRAPHASSAQAA